MTDTSLVELSGAPLVELREAVREWISAGPLEALDHAIDAPDRDAHGQAARAAAIELQSATALLEQIGWDHATVRAVLDLGTHGTLPLKALEDRKRVLIDMIETAQHEGATAGSAETALAPLGAAQTEIEQHMQRAATHS